MDVCSTRLPSLCIIVSESSCTLSLGLEYHAICVICPVKLQVLYATNYINETLCPTPSAPCPFGNPPARSFTNRRYLRQSSAHTFAARR